MRVPGRDSPRGQLLLVGACGLCHGLHAEQQLMRLIQDIPQMIRESQITIIPGPRRVLVPVMGSSIVEPEKLGIAIKKYSV